MNSTPAVKRIRVNPGQIQANFKHTQDGRPDLCKPAIVVELPNEQVIVARRVDILGPASIIQNDEQPSASGARVWIETEAELNLEL